MWKDFISLLFPNICISCNGSMNSGEEHLCSSCLLSLPQTRNHLLGSEFFSTRLAGKVQLKYCFSYLKFNKGGMVQNILYSIKYEGKKEVASFIGSLYGKELSSFSNDFDFIVPVPLHQRKYRRRGYNQSEWFANGLSAEMNVPVHDLLIRTEDRSSQTSMSRFSRWKNVKDIYQVKSSEMVKGKKVLLADDVITTGATIEACGNALLQAGVEELSVVSMALAI